MSDKDKQSDPERITVIAREFTPAALEFHRRHMGDRGYTVEGPIAHNKFLLLEGVGEPKELFDGAMYAVTFVKRKD